VILLGALSVHVRDVPSDLWLQIVEEQVPKKHLELNRRAFEAGRQAGLSKG
jgi:hypothetical protein